jgi:hypothetical protein
MNWDQRPTHLQLRPWRLWYDCFTYEAYHPEAGWPKIAVDTTQAELDAVCEFTDTNKEDLLLRQKNRTAKLELYLRDLNSTLRLRGQSFLISGFGNDCNPEGFCGAEIWYEPKRQQDFDQFNKTDEELCRECGLRDVPEYLMKKKYETPSGFTAENRDLYFYVPPSTRCEFPDPYFVNRSDVRNQEARRLWYEHQSAKVLVQIGRWLENEHFLTVDYL